MSPIPIAMSLATTFFSALTIMSTPVEYYHYGTMYTYFLLGSGWIKRHFFKEKLSENLYKLLCKAYVFCLVLSVEVFAPMYKTFGLTTLYEYLGKAFETKDQVRLSNGEWFQF